MWRYWRLIDPRKAIVATGIWMAALAFMIHLVVLSSDRYQWIDTKQLPAKAAAAAPAK
ncbi:MAG: light-harvesting protein [Betaproteobacteria bacterium]|nr:light-harvesting protein [Betaproteobacteria bacterium]NDE46832.1 light-harvesting protein [Betaproteobacteria bacterium]